MLGGGSAASPAPASPRGSCTPDLVGGAGPSAPERGGAGPDARGRLGGEL